MQGEAAGGGSFLALGTGVRLSERGLHRLVKSVRQRANLRVDGDDDDSSLYGLDSGVGGGGRGSGGEERDPRGGGGEATGVERSTLPQRHRLVDATERVAALGTTPRTPLTPHDILSSST